MLHELAVHAPPVLSQSVLLQRVWGPEWVGQGWLVRDVVKKLRRKLGDDAADPRDIVTETRVGYRMAERGTLDVGSLGTPGPSVPVRTGPQRDWRTPRTVGQQTILAEIQSQELELG